MGKNLKEVLRGIFEHRVDVVIGFVFAVLFMTFLIAWFGENEGLKKKDLIMPSIITVGLFLAWIQFLSNKSTQRKEAALTYYPRPMELEKN